MRCLVACQSAHTEGFQWFVNNNSDWCCRLREVYYADFGFFLIYPFMGVVLRRHRHTWCQHDLLRLTCLSYYFHFIVFDHSMAPGQVSWRVLFLTTLHRVHPFLDHPSSVCSQLPSSMFIMSPVPTSSHGEFQIFFNCSWSSLSTSCHTSVTPYFFW